MTGVNTTKITTGTVNVAAMALRSGQFKLRIVKPKKGRGSYSRKGKFND